jgi:hypothetical protein
MTECDFCNARWDKMCTPKPFGLSQLRYVSELELSNLAKTTADFYLVAPAGEDEFEKSTQHLDQVESSDRQHASRIHTRS